MNILYSVYKVVYTIYHMEWMDAYLIYSWAREAALLEDFGKSINKLKGSD